MHSGCVSQSIKICRIRRALIASCYQLSLHEQENDFSGRNLYARALSCLLSACERNVHVAAGGSSIVTRVVVTRGDVSSPPYSLSFCMRCAILRRVSIANPASQFLIVHFTCRLLSISQHRKIITSAKEKRNVLRKSR